MAAKVGGSKGGKYALGQNSDINVTPFVDVMLVLLIIFMVSIPPATIAIKVDLPPAIDKPNDPKDKPTFISIQQDGQIILMDKGNPIPTDLDTLEDTLTKALNSPNPKDQTILIRADRTVKYQDFMAVVDQLQTDAFYKVALINENLSA